MLVLGQPSDLSVAAALAYAGCAAAALSLRGSDELIADRHLAPDATSDRATLAGRRETAPPLPRASSIGICASCNAQNDGDANYCKSCGHRLTAEI